MAMKQNTAKNRAPSPKVKANSQRTCL